jgi:hydroxyacylglutathione hydrolase
MSAPDVRMFTVGPVQENAYIAMAARARGRAVMVDPGDEPERLLAAAHALGVEIEAILITHCHFDHIGAVAPVARATGAPVYCPEFERPLLSDIMSWVPPGFGPFESWEPEHTVKGGERLALAGFDIDVVSTPGHSPAHVTYALTVAAAPVATAAADATDDAAIADTTTDASAITTDASAITDDAAAPDAAPPAQAPALLSGDVLFQGSVGRVDLPGGDWNVLERSIATLLERFPAETVVYPGHMGTTTLGRELLTNPFLAELRATIGDAATAGVQGGAGVRGGAGGS